MTRLLHMINEGFYYYSFFGIHSDLWNCQCTLHVDSELVLIHLDWIWSSQSRSTCGGSTGTRMQNCNTWSTPRIGPSTYQLQMRIVYMPTATVPLAILMVRHDRTSDRAQRSDPTERKKWCFKFNWFHCVSLCSCQRSLLFFYIAFRWDIWPRPFFKVLVGHDVTNCCYVTVSRKNIFDFTTDSDNIQW